jgi:hypothetical protein
MINILFEAHSGWRYIVIVVAIAVFVKLVLGLVSNRQWDGWDQRLGAAFPVIMDIQFLLGLVLWIARQQWTIPLPMRTWEHPVTMILAIAVAHIAWSRVKQTETSAAKYRIGVIGYAVAGLLLTVGTMRITGMM